jgi:hypothetical protein
VGAPHLTPLHLTPLHLTPLHLTPHGATRLQRLVGNQAMLRLLGPSGPAGMPVVPGGEVTLAPGGGAGVAPRPSTVPPATGTALQRKVMIKQVPIPKIRGSYRHKEASGKGDVGKGERNVASMIGDAPVRYFESKDELYQYANQETDRIGYVESAKTWVRLPDELTVMGENHEKTPNVSHVVTATGTSRFMHEAYTERPDDMGGAEEVAALQDERSESFNPKFGVKPKGQGKHYAEDFYPKIMRGLSGIVVQNNKLLASKAEIPLLRMAILDARRLMDDDPELFLTYAEFSKLFDETAEFLKTGSSDMSPLSKQMQLEKSSRIFDDFVTEFGVYAYGEIESREARIPKADQAAFEKDYDPTKGKYPGANADEIAKAERAGDLSMYQHIKAASAKGYLLYGLGSWHRERMVKLLDREGIKHTTVDDFITSQKGAHPQK